MELRDVAERLRAERAKASPLELDEAKLRVISRASRRGSGSTLRRGFATSRLVSLMLVLGLAGGGTGALAASGAGPFAGTFKSSSKEHSASEAEYCEPESQGENGTSGTNKQLLKLSLKSKPNPAECDDDAHGSGGKGGKGDKGGKGGKDEGKGGKKSGKDGHKSGRD